MVIYTRYERNFRPESDCQIREKLWKLRTSCLEWLNNPSFDRREEQHHAYYLEVNRLLESCRRRRTTIAQLYDYFRDEILEFGRPLPYMYPNAKTIRVRTRGVYDRSTLINFFPENPGSTIQFPPGMKVILSDLIINPRIRYGLQNWLNSTVNPRESMDSTVVMAMDLTQIGGGNDFYRFTINYVGTPRVTEIRIDPIRILEYLITNRPEYLTTGKREELLRHFNLHNFHANNFSQDEFDQLLIGVGEIPDGLLLPVDGLIFERRQIVNQDPNLRSEYDIRTHTVYLYTMGYPDDPIRLPPLVNRTRLGNYWGMLSLASHLVLHEVGHALDLSPLRIAHERWRMARDSLITQFPDNGNTRGYRVVDETSNADYQENHRLITELNAAHGDLLTAHTLSGCSYSLDANSQFVFSVPRGPAEVMTFRRAMKDDEYEGSIIMPTDYPLSERDNPVLIYFAEAFALLMESPDLLLSIRPSVYSHMASIFGLSGNRFPERFE